MSIETITRNNNDVRFRAVIWVGRKRISKTFRRKIDARSWEAEMLLARDAGSLSSKRPEETVDSLWARFQSEYSEGRNAPSTRIMNANLYKNYIKQPFGTAPLNRLRPGEIEIYFNYLRRKGVSNGRINRIRQLLHVMLNRAVMWRMIDINPVTRLERLPAKDYLAPDHVRFLTEEEATLLLEWLRANDAWLYPKVVLLLHTGVRFGEMVALRVEDVRQFAASPHLSICRSRCRHTGEFRPPKGQRARMVPLSDGLLEFLLPLTTGRKADAPLLWNNWEEGRWPSRFSDHFEKAIQAAGVTRIKVHDLRHTFAVRFLEREGHLFDLKEILGHKDLKLTMRYSHFSPAMAARARGIVDFKKPAASLTVIEGGAR